MKEILIGLGSGGVAISIMFALIQRLHVRFDDYQRKDVCEKVEEKVDTQFNELRADV